MNKENKSKKKYSLELQITFLICICLYFYIIFFISYEYISIKTGICESCSGPLRLINDPLPSVIWVFVTILTAIILSKIFK